MIVTILGNTPSQKNRKKITCRGNKPRLYTEASVKAWQDSAHVQLTEQFRGLKVTEYPIDLTVTVFYGNKRRHDLDNALASVMDALVRAEVIEDDDTKHVECITVQAGYDKENPRAEIEIGD